MKACTLKAAFIMLAGLAAAANANAAALETLYSDTTFKISRTPISVPSVEASVRAKPSMIKAPDFAFSDEGYISGHVLKCITHSKRHVDVAIYGLSLPDLADALIKASQRGVKVRVIVNQSHAFGNVSPELQSLINSGINLRVLRGSGKWGIMHNKIAIFDGVLMMTGSYNWSSAADNDNYENVLFRKDGEIIKAYQAYFNWMWSRTTALSAGPVHGELPAGYYGAPPAGTGSVAFNGLVFPKCTFSPLGGSENTIINAINASRSTIYVAMYSFYSSNIANALLEAKKRGVAVRIVVDSLQASGSPLTKFFVENGFNFRKTSGFKGGGIMHHKFAVFDSQLLMSGSFNWSISAESNNFENALISNASNDISGFSQEFEKIFAKANPVTLADLEKQAEIQKYQLRMSAGIEQ